MQVHTLAAEHTFVYRMIFVAFNCNLAVLLLVNYYTTTHAAIAAGCSEVMGMFSSHGFSN
jgi:hypothetical protein